MFSILTYSQNYTINSFSINVSPTGMANVKTSLNNNEESKYILIKEIDTIGIQTKSENELYYGNMDSILYLPPGKYLVKTIVTYKNNQRKIKSKYIYIKHT